MDDIAIRVERLGKLYHIGKREERYDSPAKRLSQVLLGPVLRGAQAPRPDETIWALKDVSFEVGHGDAVGIIGPNGAGKSTLLKLLSGLTTPTEGRITIRGRIGSMLEIGTGFNPELTGRENVFLNGVILGMKRAEIQRKFDEIVAFSGVEKFLDMPVKRYSSGMRVRLAFSVIAHLEPEILLIDEVLSVGDAAFRRKSMTKMEDLIQGGRTVLFVSHNERAIADLCDSTIRLDDGRIVDRGPSSDVVRKYLEEQFTPHRLTTSWAKLEADRSKAMCLRSVAIVNDKGELADEVEMSRPFRVRVEYDVNELVSSAHVICFINTADGVNVLGSGDADCAPERLGPRAVGSYAGEFQVPECLLDEGRYSITVSMGIPFEEVFDRQESIVAFKVRDDSSLRRRFQKKRRPGILGLDLPWDYETRNSTEGVSTSVASKREAEYGEK
jgi:lipopolysaccharide transport system ATP-binding protein